LKWARRKQPRKREVWKERRKKEEKWVVCLKIQGDTIENGDLEEEEVVTSQGMTTHMVHEDTKKEMMLTDHQDLEVDGETGQEVKEEKEIEVMEETDPETEEDMVEIEDTEGIETDTEEEVDMVNVIEKETEEDMEIEDTAIGKEEDTVTETEEDLVTETEEEVIEIEEDPVREHMGIDHMTEGMAIEIEEIEEIEVDMKEEDMVEVVVVEETEKAIEIMQTNSAQPVIHTTMKKDHARRKKRKERIEMLHYVVLKLNQSLCFAQEAQ